METQRPGAGMLTLDVDEGCVIRDGVRLRLSPKDAALIEYLLRHRGRVIPHHELLEAVWAGVHVTPDVLKVRVARVRRILGDTAQSPRFIKNFHGDGYALVGRAPIQLGVEHRPADALPLVAAGNTESAAACREAHVVGREAELARLLELLEIAAGGTRQLVFVAGEPGIGKTTLIERFIEQVSCHWRNDVHSVWVGRGQCVEHYGRGEPYLPVMEAFERLARGRARSSFTRALRRYAPTWLPHFASLLSDDERDSIERGATPATSNRMVRELAHAIEALTTDDVEVAPTLILVLEDLHWADVSTIDFLAVLAHRLDPARVLVVGSFRSSEIAVSDGPLRALLHDVRGRRTVHEIDLTPLREVDVAEYLNARFPDHLLPDAVATRLCLRTEGHPLFLTDLIRDLVTTGVISRGVRWTFNGTADTVDRMTPLSIRHLLTRQRDRLSDDDQRLLEAASIVGVEFGAIEVAAAMGADATTIEDRCLQLAERQQFVRLAGSQEWPDGTESTRFSFLHAVYRELWEERIGAGRRREWHLRLAQRKEAAYGPRSREIASELATHFAQGHDYLTAIAYHEIASQQANLRAASIEACAHLDRAFALLDRLPEAPERMPRELALQIRRGTLLAMTDGYGADATVRAFERAREICTQIGDTASVFDWVYGLCRVFWVKGELESARDLAQQLLRISERDPDPVRAMASHAAVAQVRCMRGELNEALAHGKEGLALFCAHAHGQRPDQALVYGHIGILSSGSAASSLLLLGYPTASARYVDTMLSFAAPHAHPFVAGLAWWGTGLYSHIRGERARLARAADELGRIASAHELVEFAPYADVFRGAAMAMCGRGDEGLVDARRGAEMLRRFGARLLEPHALGIVAACESRIGKLESARHTVDEALDVAARMGRHWYQAELHRLQGRIIERTAAANARCHRHTADHEAEQCFVRALEVARRDDAKWWELRAALALGALWRRQGKDDDARNIVSKTFGLFTEGFDMEELRAARHFLTGSRFLRRPPRTGR